MGTGADKLLQTVAAVAIIWIIETTVVILVWNHLFVGAESILGFSFVKLNFWHALGLMVMCRCLTASGSD